MAIVLLVMWPTLCYCCTVRFKIEASSSQIVRDSRDRRKEIDGLVESEPAAQILNLLWRPVRSIGRRAYLNQGLFLAIPIRTSRYSETAVARACDVHYALNRISGVIRPYRLMAYTCRIIVAGVIGVMSCSACLPVSQNCFLATLAFYSPSADLSTGRQTVLKMRIEVEFMIPSTGLEMARQSTDQRDRRSSTGMSSS